MEQTCEFIVQNVLTGVSFEYIRVILIYTKTDTMKYANKSIEKAFRVLDLFDKETRRLSATEIARCLSTTPSVLYPILCTLESYGYLSRDEQKKYELGFKFLDRANLVLQHIDLYTHAKPYLRELAFGQSVNAHLGVFYGNRALYLHREVGGGSVIIGEVVGLREPAYCTALGKTLLAFLPDAAFESYLSKEEFIPFTAYTIVDTARLRTERARIRKDGFAISDQEAHEGVIGVGAPVTDFIGEARAAISISVPKSRWEQEKGDLIAAVRRTALHLSRDLGHNRERSEVEW
jgi:IclR family KDG regulon transcriptional repressor